jgi:hypothetical protein
VALALPPRGEFARLFARHDDLSVSGHARARGDRRHAVPPRHHRRRLDLRGRRDETFLQVEPEALTLLTREAMRDIAHLLRPWPPAAAGAILDDPEASPNDRFVALDLLRNAADRRRGVLPSCQDTGTAIISGKKGQLRVDRRRGRGRDRARVCLRPTSDGQTCATRQLAPLDMYTEKNTNNNLPAQIEIATTDGDAVQVPVHGQRRRLGEQELSVSRDEGAAQPEEPHRVPRGEDPERSAPPPARRTTSPSSSAAPRRSTRSRQPSTPRPGTSTACPPRQRPWAAASAT